MAKRLRTDLPVELSPRETQLLEFAAAGLTDQAIANELGISLATIATYWGRIRIKFGPLSRTEIVAMHLRSSKDQEIAALQEEIRLMRVQLQQTHSELALLVAAANESPDSIVVIDRTAMILYANVVTGSWLGYEVEQIVGKRTADFYVEERLPRWQYWFEHVWDDPGNPLFNPVTAYFRHSEGDVIELECFSKIFVWNSRPHMVISSRLVQH